MYALTQDLARTRMLYPRPVPTLPDILVLDIPDRFAHPALPMGRFYPILIETDAERDELDRFLGSARDGPIVPDLLDHRPTQLETGRIVFATYAPPEHDWPFVLLCHWPAAFSAMAVDTSLFARGAYTSEMFETEAELAAAADRLLEVLGRSSDLSVTFLAAGQLIGGRA